VDACHSSALFVTVKGDEPARFVLNQPPSPEEFDNFSDPARQFLTAADDEVAPSPSAFSAAFVLGIEGGADLDGDGVVRFSELTDYVKKMVLNAGSLRTRPTSGLIPQKPGEIADSGNGEMVFRYLPADKSMSYDRMVGVGKTYLLQANALPAEPTAVKWPYRGYLRRLLREECRRGTCRVRARGGIHSHPPDGACSAGSDAFERHCLYGVYTDRRGQGSGRRAHRRRHPDLRGQPGNETGRNAASSDPGFALCPSGRRALQAADPRRHRQIAILSQYPGFFQCAGWSERSWQVLNEELFCWGARPALPWLHPVTFWAWTI
jgi:hypothetical protein